MSIGQQVRQGAIGIERAAFNASMVKFLAFEALASAVAAGIALHSLGWGLGTFFGVVLLANIPAIRVLLAIAMSAGWGALAYIVLRAVDAGEPMAAYGSAAAAFVLAIAAHACLFQWQQDFRSAG
jgi:hypothetical protein